MRNGVKLFIALILVLTTIFSVGITMAKYKTTISTLPNLTIDITGFDYLRARDSGKTSTLVTGYSGNTSLNITEGDIYTVNFSGDTVSGLFEKTNIPIYFPSTGVYQLNFTVVANQNRIYDENYQIYGCTVSDSINVGSGQDSMIRQNGIANTGFFWNSITPTDSENVTITINVTDASKPMYWVWDLCNIADGKNAVVNLTNISITKTTKQDGIPYIDFPNSSIYYKYNTSSPTNEVFNTKGISLTNGSYNDLLFRCELVTGFENVCIPIKNLTVGTTYQLLLDLSHTNNTAVNAGYDSGKHTYGFYVSDSEITTAENRITNTGVSHYSFNDKSIDFANSTLENITYEFTATSETMYWIWDLSGIHDDNEWMKIHIYNCEINSANAAMLSMFEDEINDDTTTSTVTNTFINTPTNTIDNTSDTNTLVTNETNSNIVSNEISNEANSNIISNEISNEANSNIVSDEVSNEADSNIVSNEISNEANSNTVSNEISNEINSNNVINDISNQNENII